MYWHQVKDSDNKEATVYEMWTKADGGVNVRSLVFFSQNVYTFLHDFVLVRPAVLFFLCVVFNRAGCFVT